MNKLTTIDFHGTKLIAIAGDRPETTLVAMKPIVEGMGLDWERQRRTIHAHPVLKAAPSTQTVQMPDDNQAREHLFMPLARVNFWLATINPNLLKDEKVKERVVEYQTEAADVLFNYFFGRAISTPKPKAPRAPALIGPRRQTLGLIELYTRVNEMRGLDRNAALISANDRASVKTGINLFEEAGPVCMEAPDQEPVMNVTAIAEAIGGISNRRINPALIEMGYQTKGGKGCRCPYQATDLGKPHSRVVDSPRKHASGFSQELLWKPSIIPLIQAHLAGVASPYAAVALAADADLVPQGGLL